MALILRECLTAPKIKVCSKLILSFGHIASMHRAWLSQSLSIMNVYQEKGRRETASFIASLATPHVLRLRNRSLINRDRGLRQQPAVLD